MKIECVESLLIGGAHFVEVTTDNGIKGLGQSGCWAYPEAVGAVVSKFESYLVGKDPRRTEHHWQQLYRMGPFRGSILGGALSAIDIALWDIKGRYYQAPIWDLLGGNCRNRIRLQLLILGDFDPQTIANKALEGAEQGFTAIKFDPIPTAAGDLSLDRLVHAVTERVAAARAAVGRDIDIILELHRRLTPLQALSVIECVRQFNPLFVEDPIQIDSIVSQSEIARRVNVPMGNGERLNTIWEFRELLALGGSQYVRPDLGLAGGITHCKKIAAIAESFHAAVVSHNFLGPVLTAASAHLDFAIPNFVVQEYSQIDEAASASAYVSSLQREGGYLMLPEEPGLGVRLSSTRDVWLSPLSCDLHQIPLRSDGSVSYSV
ncbi:mandelate racemase/muconate lactonizing enzyme family protein [Bradyrhizobium manausense]